MDKQEVKEEHKSTELPPEVKGAIRRRAMRARPRPHDGRVPTADVVVTNPTHFSVALKLRRRRRPRPEVVAKGPDLLALQIRELAAEHGVPVIARPAAGARPARLGRGRPA